MNKIQTCPVTGLPAIEFGGILRRLGTLPRAGPQRFRSFGDAGIPDVPRSDWREIDRRSAMPWILDQKSHGSCTGHGSAGGLMRARRLRGLTHALLSGAYPYSFVNGGQDNGASIGDLLPVLRDRGTCLLDQCGWDQIYPSEYDQAACGATAKRFRVEDAYVPSTWQQFMSGLMLGYIPVFAVMVGNSFTTLRDGVAGFDGGPGNHCVHADGVRQHGGDWQPDMINSWGTSFGTAGRAYIAERHFDGIGYQDCYMIKAAVEDPQEPDPLPPAKE